MMWSPYDSQIDDIYNDRAVIGEAIFALCAVDERVGVLASIVSALGSRISFGFTVSCSATSMTNETYQSLCNSRNELDGILRDLEAELSSLRRQKTDWLRESEQEKQVAESLEAEDRRGRNHVY